MRTGILIASLVLMTACAAPSEKQIEAREYRDAERLAKFLEIRRRCLDSGGILVGWLELNKQDISVFQVARWKDNAWAPLGELGGGKQHVSNPLLEVSPIGAVAVWREPESLGVDLVRASVLDVAKGVDGKALDRLMKLISGMAGLD